jgi:tetratricopeptide (TPR) repeat protein
MKTTQKRFLDFLTIARKHFEKKEYKNARLIYFQALNSIEDPESKAIVWAEVSWVYFYEKNFEKAIEAAENVLLHNQSYRARDDIYRVQGYAYLALGDLTLAERSLQLSLGENNTAGKQQYVKYELGKLYFSQGNYDLAHPYFKEILDYFQSRTTDYTWSIMFYLGFIFYYLQNYEKARNFFNQILADNPPVQRQVSAKFGIAFLEFQQKNYMRVISLCEEILTQDENFFDKESVGFLTAASYFYLGRQDIFSAYFKKMKESYPEGRYNKDLDRLQATGQSG